jgi:hypothetical protein
MVLTFLLVFNSAFPVTVRLDATPQAAPDTVASGVPFNIEIYLNNNNDMIQMAQSYSLIFYSPDSSIEYAPHFNVQGHGAQTIDFPHIQYNDSSILFYNDYETYWNFMNCWYGFGWDGYLPDSMNTTGASLDGWPSDLGEELYVTLAFIVEETGTFCVDSLDHPLDTYDWLFEPVGGDHQFNGPYCWTVAEMPFLCGDANSDDNVNLLDITYLINYLYKGSEQPYPYQSGDVNGNGILNLLDVTHLLNYLYNQGQAPDCESVAN